MGSAFIKQVQAVRVPERPVLDEVGFRVLLYEKSMARQSKTNDREDNLGGTLVR